MKGKSVYSGGILTETTLQEKKRHIRNRLKKIRAALPEASRHAASATIARKILAMEEVTRADSVFCFISYGNEVDTHGLLEYFLAQGKHLAVPKILPDKTMIAVPFAAWSELKPGELGILTPASSLPEDRHFDVVITPGLGFTAEGFRIGYGRGYYDKWFAGHPAGRKIAVCFDAQLVDELPVDTTDVPVDSIVTEKRIIIPRDQ